jgi:hypothetical protein
MAALCLQGWVTLSTSSWLYRVTSNRRPDFVQCIENSRLVFEERVTNRTYKRTHEDMLGIV